MFETATVTMSLRDYNQLQNGIEQRGFWYDRLAKRIREAVNVDTGDYVGDEIVISYIDEEKLLEIVKDLIEEEENI